MDIGSIFDQRLPAALARNAEEARAINATYQLSISDIGDWFLDLTSRGPSVVRGVRPADCSVTLVAADFEKLVQNPASAIQLYFAGRLKIKGSPMAALKLQKLFSFR